MKKTKRKIKRIKPQMSNLMMVWMSPSDYDLWMAIKHCMNLKAKEQK